MTDNKNLRSLELKVVTAQFLLTSARIADEGRDTEEVRARELDFLIAVQALDDRFPRNAEIYMSWYQKRYPFVGINFVTRREGLYGCEIA